MLCCFLFFCFFWYVGRDFGRDFGRDSGVMYYTNISVHPMCAELLIELPHPLLLHEPPNNNEPGIPVLSSKETSTVAVATLPAISSTAKKLIVELSKDPKSSSSSLAGLYG